MIRDMSMGVSVPVHVSGVTPGCPQQSHALWNWCGAFERQAMRWPKQGLSVSTRILWYELGLSTSSHIRGPEQGLSVSTRI